MPVQSTARLSAKSNGAVEDLPVAMRTAPAAKLKQPLRGQSDRSSLTLLHCMDPDLSESAQIREAMGEYGIEVVGYQSGAELDRSARISTGCIVLDPGFCDSLGFNAREMMSEGRLALPVVVAISDCTVPDTARCWFLPAERGCSFRKTALRMLRLFEASPRRAAGRAGQQDLCRPLRRAML